MLETYRRDDGIGGSALESYERCIRLHIALRTSLSGHAAKPVALPPVEPLREGAEIVTLPSRPCRVSPVAPEHSESAGVLRVKFG